MPTIRVTVDDKLALTTEQAADELGLTPSAFRVAMTPSRRPADPKTGLPVEPVAKLGRQPLYPAVPLRRAWKARPGKGASLRRKGGGPAPAASRRTSEGTTHAND